MDFRDFAKRTIVVGVTPFPWVQTTPPEAETVISSQGREFRTQFAWGVSLRTPNPNDPAQAGGPARLVPSRENLGFATLRDDHVIGLDVTEDGQIISIFDLEKARLAANIAKQQARAEAATTSVTVDLDMVVAEA